VVLDEGAVHEILETKQWISITENNIILGRTFRINLFRYPAEALSRIRKPLQILPRVGFTRVRLESRQNFGTVAKVFGSFER
jgi:hypothetical protein